MTDTQLVNFSEDIKRKRERLGLKQYECAKHCGISVNSYRFWEMGLTKPKEKNVITICAFLGLNASDYSDE